MLKWREQWFDSRELPVLPEVLGVPESELGMEHGSADEAHRRKPRLMEAHRPHTVERKRS